jgi:uncharacterized DUF497 family protein
MAAIRRLIWSDWNKAHMARHRVTSREVEEVFQGESMFRPSYSNRLAVTGPTKADRVLTVIIEPLDKPGDYFPITARTASRKERRLYEDFIRKGGDGK